MLKEDDLITIRRHLHQIPEVALEEVETHAFLMQVIGMMDQKFLKILEPKELPTAILVRVQGSDPSRTIGYRTDIDGLPVDEKQDFRTHRSIREKCMPAAMICI